MGSENNRGITSAEVDALYEKLKREQGESGYNLNPDVEFTKALVHSLLINQERYGYQACPCRLAEGVREADLDIICPCDYRDPDLNDYNACFCGLYVTEPVMRGEIAIRSIPERRPPPEEREAIARKQAETPGSAAALKYPVWRCRVCGYLCARDEAPERCPICKVKKDRFERFM